jgi:hypothetical protein
MTPCPASLFITDHSMSVMVKSIYVNQSCQIHSVHETGAK